MCAVSEKLVIAFLMRHFDEVGKPGGWNARREDHQKSVKSLIEGCLQSYPDKLGPAECAINTQLCDDGERATFRICRDLAKRDDSGNGNPPGIFPLAYGELAARLDCSNGCAEHILKYRFDRELKILRVETLGLARQKGKRALATRWRWLIQSGCWPAGKFPS